MDLNFALKPNSKAVDAGVIIPTVNDGFAGRAPDLGAIESGKPVPRYGPRWLGLATVLPLTASGTVGFRGSCREAPGNVAGC